MRIVKEPAINFRHRHLAGLPGYFSMPVILNTYHARSEMTVPSPPSSIMAPTDLHCEKCQGREELEQSLGDPPELGIAQDIGRGE